MDTILSFQNVNYFYQTKQDEIYALKDVSFKIEKEDFFTYMMRDKIVFEVDKYAYEKELKKMTMEEFIDFCIRNKKYIIRETMK